MVETTVKSDDVKVVNSQDDVRSSMTVDDPPRRFAFRLSTTFNNMHTRSVQTSKCVKLPDPNLTLSVCDAPSVTPFYAKPAVPDGSSLLLAQTQTMMSKSTEDDNLGTYWTSSRMTCGLSWLYYRIGHPGGSTTGEKDNGCL